MKSRFWLIVIFYSVLTCGWVLSALAYTDEIDLPIDEVWSVVQTVFQEPGIKKLSHDKKELKTKWFEDTVTRERRLLPFKKLREIQKVVERRTVLNVRLKEIVGVTQVRIEGKFQERQKDESPNRRWRNVKPKSEDYDVEKQYFFKILKALEDKKFSERIVSP